MTKSPIDLFYKGISSPSWLFCHELQRLLEFADATEQFLNSHKAAFEKAIEEKAKELAQEAKDDLYGWHSDDWHRLEQEFPQTLRSSLAISVYAEFEHFLLSRARYLGASQKRRIMPKDLKSKGIRSALEYYKLVLDVPFPDDSPEWGEILSLNRIRNCLVHSTGEIADDDKAMITLVEKHPHLSLSNLSKIMLDDQYVPFVIGMIASFAKLLDGKDGMGPMKMLHVT